MGRRILIAGTIGAAVLAGACATLSPSSRIETRLVQLGVSRASADCLASELAGRLDRSDLSDIANFLDDIRDADSSGGVVRRLGGIRNARAAAAVAASAITCALGG